MEGCLPHTSSDHYYCLCRMLMYKYKGVSSFSHPFSWQIKILLLCAARSIKNGKDDAESPGPKYLSICDPDDCRHGIFDSSGSDFENFSIQKSRNFHQLCRPFIYNWFS